jgi:hypothetical protein
MGWLAPVGLVLIRLFVVEARLAQTQAQGGILVFRTGVGFRALIVVGTAIIGWQMVREFRTAETWVLCMCSAILLFAFFAWPSTIAVGVDSVSQHRWWRKSVRIPWSEVTAIQKNAVGDMQVFGIKGQTITFTRYHVNPARFEEEVKERASLTSTIDASALPTIRPGRPLGG